MRPLSPLRRILMVRTDRMGDLLMTLPAVRCVREELPQAELTLLLQRGMRDLLEGHPDLDRILEWNPDEGKPWGASFRNAARLRPFRFDVAVVFNPTRLFHAAVFLAGIPVRIGYRRKWGQLLTHSIPDTKGDRNLREVEYNLELIRLLGLAGRSPELRLPPRPETDSEARRILQSWGLDGSRPIVALHPWTSNPSKAWPVESFGALSRRIAQRGAQPLLIGEPPPGPADDWLSRFPPEAANLVGQVPLRALPGLLRRCSLLVSNDSGPVHVAAAVGTPTVVISPRGHGRQLQRWRPWGESHRLLLDPTVEEVLSALALPCGS